MTSLEPFRGLRYDTAQVPMDQVIAPPYDVVSPAQRAHLANRSPYNSIHLELPESDLVGGRDRYQVAAELLAGWQGRHVLVAEGEPALYPYRMTMPSGETTNGVLGALVIGDGVRPHEQTLPKAKTDRLDLLRATRANLSPIWGLSLTPGLTALFEQSGPPVEDAYDDDGVRHQLWVITDPEQLAAIGHAIAASPVVLADGHHRYETAGNYRREVQAAHGQGPGDQDAVLALVVELTEEQIHLGAIHRLVNDLPAGTDPVQLFSTSFDAVRAGNTNERVVGALAEANSNALVTPDGAWLLNPRSEAYEAAGTDLDSGLVSHVLADVPEATVTYANSWRDALSAVESGEAQLAVVMRPATVEQISAWAEAGRLMPPKTTFFMPKPRTGMVIRVLAEPS